MGVQQHLMQRTPTYILDHGRSIRLAITVTVNERFFTLSYKDTSCTQGNKSSPSHWGTALSQQMIAAKRVN